MKLRVIAEAKSNEPIRDAAKALSSLIKFVRDNFESNSNEYKSLYAFLRQPTSRSWYNTKWIIDSVSKLALQSPKSTPEARKWVFLKSLTSPTIASSVYDIDRKSARGTPLSTISMSKPNRDKLKTSLGPEGYVSALSDIAGEVQDNHIKHLLKNTASRGNTNIKAAKRDLPHVKKATKF